jgi:hypothetical protein
MNLTFSRRAAAYGGVILPALEAWRRRGEWGEIAKWPFILDDFLVGALLLWGAWAVGRSIPRGRPILAAAWGVAFGMIYGSFFSQLVALRERDPSGVDARIVVLVKALLFGLAIAGLVGALRTESRDAQ